MSDDRTSEELADFYARQIAEMQLEMEGMSPTSRVRLLRLIMEGRCLHCGDDPCVCDVRYD